MTPLTPWKNAQPLPGSASDMIIRIMILFLIGIAVLAMFGRLRVRLPGGRQLAKCRTCGKYRIGKGPCDCSRSS